MHIEIQVALNFVISYLYNKLPRRRVNIFGEELEKALKDKFQGHWYPEKPFKGSAYRCLKIGDPTDSVLSRAARESGVPITDILENLPNELSVWVDPGEVSYRIGEKGAVKILYSENSDNHEENNSADREVNKTFNPEAQVFRPIDIINNGMNGLSLSPKTSPHAGSSPHSASSTSPTYKGSPNPATAAAAVNGSVPYMTRLQAPLTFTTATFAQTKFGSTKLKTNSKRSNSSAYRMSPTEFSNYIKQRAMQQQLHHGMGANGGGPQQNHYGPIGAVSPARSISPNPLPLGMNQGNDPFFMHNMSNNMYPQFNGHRNIYDGQYQMESNGSLYGVNNTAGHNNKFGAYLEPHGFYGMGGGNHQQQQQPQHQQQQSPQHHQQQQQQHHNNHHQQQQQQQQQKQSPQQPNGIAKTAINGGVVLENANNKDAAIGTVGIKNTTTTITVTVTSSGNSSEPQSPTPTPPTPTSASSSSVSPSGGVGVGVGVGGGIGIGNNTTNAANTQDSNSNSKLIDGLNSFYSNATGYQQLLVAN